MVMGMPFGSCDFFLYFSLGFSITLEDHLAFILFTHINCTLQGGVEGSHHRTFSCFYNRLAHLLQVAYWWETGIFCWHAWSILWGQECVCSTCNIYDKTLRLCWKHLAWPHWFCFLLDHEGWSCQHSVYLFWVCMLSFFPHQHYQKRWIWIDLRGKWNQKGLVLLPL